MILKACITTNKWFGLGINGILFICNLNLNIFQFSISFKDHSFDFIKWSWKVIGAFSHDIRPTAVLTRVTSGISGCATSFRISSILAMIVSNIRRRFRFGTLGVRFIKITNIIPVWCQSKLVPVNPTSRWVFVIFLEIRNNTYNPGAFGIRIYCSWVHAFDHLSNVCHPEIQVSVILAYVEVRHYSCDFWLKLTSSQTP